jgi:hypothetical protein
VLEQILARFAFIAKIRRIMATRRNDVVMVTTIAITSAI